MWLIACFVCHLPWPVRFFVQLEMIRSDEASHPLARRDLRHPIPGVGDCFTFAAVMRISFKQQTTQVYNETLQN